MNSNVLLAKYLVTIASEAISNTISDYVIRAFKHIIIVSKIPEGEGQREGGGRKEDGAGRRAEEDAGGRRGDRGRRTAEGGGRKVEEEGGGQWEEG